MVSTLLMVSHVAAEIRDPTAPPAAVLQGLGNVVTSVPSQPEGLQLNSVLISPTRKIAIINNKVVAEGAQVFEYQVVTIDHSGVLLRSNNREKFLQLKAKRQVKQPSAN